MQSPSHRLRFLIGCRMLMTLTSCCYVIILTSGTEYCLNQSFEAKCSPQEVIMVHQASYGRMKLGTCVQKDYGSMGCQADVTEVLSGACSGKDSCRIVNMEAFFSKFNRCPLDLKSYLDANVTCLTVRRHPCSSDGLIHLAAHTIDASNVISGSVPMVISGETEFMECPYVLEAKRGQRINVTLTDFFELTSSSHAFDTRQQQGNGEAEEKFHKNGETEEHLCKKYVTIWDGSEVKNLVMCRRNAEVFGRMESVYLSSGSKIRVKVEAGITQRFIVTYNVIGCPFPDLPADSHILAITGRDVRWPTSMPKITIRCNQSDDSLVLTCKNGIYAGDNEAVLNCTRKLPQGTGAVLGRYWGSTGELSCAVSLTRIRD